MNVKEKVYLNGNAALRFINDKYHQEFTPSTYEMADYLSETDTVYFYVEGMDRENESVEVYVTKENRELAFYDNYFSYLVRPEAEAYIGKMVEKEFSEFKVYRDNEYGALPNELTSECNLEDLYRVKNDYHMNAKVYIKGNPMMTATEYEEKFQRIEQELISSGHGYTIYFFAVSNEVYQSIERYEQDDFWAFYTENREPDGVNYYHWYKVRQ